MNPEILILAFVLAFLFSFYYMPKLIGFLNRRKKFLGPDENKLKKPFVPSMGGLVVFIAFMFAVISVILISLFFNFKLFQLEHLLLPLLTIGLVAFLGLADDVLEPQKRFVKPVLALFAAIPAMALTHLSTSIIFPFFGAIEFGILFNILFIPLVIIFTSNAINIMEGYNGLGAGMSLIISLGLLVISVTSGNFIASLLIVSLISPLIILFYFNKFPAKIFPGNIGTLFFGAVIAVSAIIAKIEFALFIMMIPFFIHFFLYSRNLYKFKPVMWGVIQKNGSLKCPYKKPFGLMHLLLINFSDISEKKLVNLILLIEVFFVLLAIVFTL